jgi:hypothetical protein
MTKRVTTPIISRATAYGVTAFRTCFYVLSALCSLIWLYRISAVKAQTDGEPLLRGRVVFADGMFAPGAKVEAILRCDGFGIVKNTTTADDGSFSFHTFSQAEIAPSDIADCKQYQFRASKREDYWLPSDGDAAFTSEHPALPAIGVPFRLPLEPVQIVLKFRGGKVRFRVWDIATDRFIGATLELDRKPVEGKKFGSMLFRISDDGTAAAELLPAGRYSVRVQSYPCGAEEYWTAIGPTSSFAVEAADNVDETIRIDVRTIEPLSGEHGRRRKNCKP